MKEKQQELREIKTEDALNQLQSYIKIADVYISEKSDNNREIYHLGLIIDKMQEIMDEMKLYYEILDDNAL